MDNRAILLVENGKETIIKLITLKKISNEFEHLYEIYSYLNCFAIDVLPLPLGNAGILNNIRIVIDDEGQLKDNPMVNFVVSALFGQRIVGNALILSVNKDGSDRGLSTTEYSVLFRILKKFSQQYPNRINFQLDDFD